MRRAHVVKTVMCLILAAAVLAPEGFAQQSAEPINIRKLNGSKAKTPEYKLIGETGFIRVTKDWFMINAQYDSSPDWIDEITFTYYVLIRGRTSDQPKYTLLTGDVTYVNVQKGRHLSDMYLHPSTLSRYGEVQSIAVIVKVQGRVVAMGSEPSSTQRWWEQLSPVQGLVLNRMQTPFAMIGFDSYEAIKMQSGTR